MRQNVSIVFPTKNDKNVKKDKQLIKR